MSQLPAHFFVQNDLRGFPLILLVCDVDGKVTRLNRPRRVDREDTCSYIGFTYLAQFAGQFLERFISTGPNSPTCFPSYDPMNLRRRVLCADVPFSPEGARQKRLWQAVPEFHDLRDSSITKNEGNWLNFLHRDRRSPNRSANSLYPGTTRIKTKSAGNYCLGRTSHGVARATESMRGLRLSLVPCPEPRNGLLPAV